MNHFELEELILHTKSMSLLDSVIDCNLVEGILTTNLAIKEDTLFLSNKGVPCIVGIEYMAQTVAAYSGVLDREHKQKNKIGLLLGTRHYKAEIPYFILGDLLTIRCEEVHIDESGLAVFNCDIKSHLYHNQIVAKSRLNVIHSDIRPT